MDMVLACPHARWCHLSLCVCIQQVILDSSASNRRLALAVAPEVERGTPVGKVLAGDEPMMEHEWRSAWKLQKDGRWASTASAWGLACDSTALGLAPGA